MDKVLILSQDDLDNAIKNAVGEVLRNVKTEEHNPEFVTIKQACEILGASRGSLYNWTKMGLLKIHSIAGSKRFKYSEIIDAPKKIKRYERRPTSWKEVKANSTKIVSRQNSKCMIIKTNSLFIQFLRQNMIKNGLESVSNLNSKTGEQNT